LRGIQFWRRVPRASTASRLVLWGFDAVAACRAGGCQGERVVVGLVRRLDHRVGALRRRVPRRCMSSSAAAWGSYLRRSWARLRVSSRNSGLASLSVRLAWSWR